MSTVLIVGATRGLGAHLAAQYSARSSTKVLATSRGSSQPSLPSPASTSNIHWVSDIDISQQTCGEKLAKGSAPHGPVDTVIINAGFFGKESFDEPDWDAQVRMYTTSAIGPVFAVQKLVKEGVVKAGAKIALVTSEAGSIGLRHPKEGGGLYGHHASKAAENMAGRLLSLDLKEKQISVVMVHPGFMRTEMTRNVGFDKYWDDGGAVTPDVAAGSLIDWLETKFTPEMTGQYWAPRGPRGNYGQGPTDAFAAAMVEVQRRHHRSD